MNFKAIGQRIKSRRKELNMTQEELAERLDISVEYTSRVERGSVSASFQLFEKVCAALGISEEELYFGKTGIYQDEKVLSAFKNLPPEKQYAAMKIIEIISEI